MAANLKEISEAEGSRAPSVGFPLMAPEIQMMGLLRADGPIHTFSYRNIDACLTQHYLYGRIALPALEIETATFDAYTRIFELLSHQTSYRMIRAWHFFPGINALNDGMERYWLFSRARHQAFQNAGYQMDSDLPAATAIGSESGPLVIHFLAGIGDSTSYENPRQLSAYRYPPEYGPRSPSFSRSIRHTNSRDSVFFISGTASIIGHKTIAPRDPSHQTRLTLENIDTLLAHAGYGPIPTLASSASWRVYYRDANDHDLIKSIVSTRVPPEAQIELIQGDICRQDLRVEMEGMVCCHKESKQNERS